MPTALGGRGKLFTCSALSQVTRSQRSHCAGDNLEDMTQSWPSQQALGGDQAQRILYSSQDTKLPTQQRQSRGNVPLVLTRHPRLAPHKSMRAHDQKMSSDDEDVQRGTREPASRDAHRHTHGGRVRHSSSDSSAGSAESCSGDLRSPNPGQSPEVHRDPWSPVDTRPPFNDEETDHPSAAQWQLDKWLKKSHKKCASGEQYPSQVIPGHSPSAHNHRAPSPARSWDSKEEYSPSQSPILSPRSHCGPDSPLPSPGYSHCPSPSPFPSTCPSHSPSLSPRNGPIRGPVPSVCPSPHGSPRASRSPSPIPKDPPKNTCPGVPAPSRAHHYAAVQSHHQTQPGLTTDPHRAPTGSWVAQRSNIRAKSKAANGANRQPSHRHRLKTRLIQNQDHSQSKLSAVSDSNRVHRLQSRPKPSFHPGSRQLSGAPRSKPSPHFEQIQTSRSIRDSTHNPRLSVQSISQHSPARGRHVPPTGRETNSGHGRLPQSTSTTDSNSNTGLNSRSKASLKSQARSREFAAPTTAHVNLTETTPKKPRSERRAVEKGDHLCQAEGRKQGRKESRHRGKQQGKRERGEERRLAEEQLLRRPLIQSSAEEEEEVEEEEEEEEGVIERQRKNEETASGGNSGRRERRHRREWQTEQTERRLRTDAERRRLPEDAYHQGRTRTKGGRSEEGRDFRREPSPPPSHSPAPRRPSLSSSAASSSSTDSESEDRPPVSKVPADSTSYRAASAGERRGTDAGGPRAVLPGGGAASGDPREAPQSQPRRKLYTLVPFGRGEQSTASSQRGLRNLVVQIDLCLLQRVPEGVASAAVEKPPTSSSSSTSATRDKRREAMKHLCVPEAMAKDGKRKRKMENGVSHMESKRSAPLSNDLSGCAESSSQIAERNFATETAHNGYLEEYLDSKRPLSPLSPLSDSPPETTKPPTKPRTSEQHHVEVHKIRHRNKESATKPKTEAECVRVSRQPPPPSESWGPARHRGAVPNYEAPHHAEYYLHEAKRMKHRADAMVDKLGKAVNYIDAALSFMECGKAMEEGPLEAKSPYTMYSETVELIRYAMRLKSHSGPGARQEDKQLAVLCFRCLALLYWQMFQLKKDHALKYSKVLLDYFKSSPRVPSTSPCWSDSRKGTGETPPSLTPDTKHLKQGSHGAGSIPSFISIPQRIHQMAANHLNITNSVLYSYEYWEVADNLAKENKEFFNYLNTLSGPLTLHSSIAHAVQYTRQALQWIRISAKLN